MNVSLFTKPPSGQYVRLISCYVQMFWQQFEALTMIMYTFNEISDQLVLSYL